jgi:hypothetical protein
LGIARVGLAGLRRKRERKRERREPTTIAYS